VAQQHRPTPADAVREPARSGAAVARARLAVTAIFLANGAGIGLWAGLVAALGAKHALSHGQISVILLAMAAGAVTAMSTTGWLTARYGSRRCTIAAGVLTTLLLPLPYLMPGLTSVALAAAALGAANGTMDVAMNAHGAAVERRLGRPAMSWFHAFFSIGGVIGSTAGASLLALDLALGAVALTVATALLATVVVASSTLLRGPLGEGGRAGFVRPTGALLLLCVLAFLAMISEGAMFDWVGVQLARGMGVELSTAALGYTVYAGCMTAGRLVGDRLVAALGAPRVLVASALVSLGGTSLFLAAPTVALAFLGIAAAGLGVANLVPILFGAGAHVPGVAPGQGVAMVAMSGYAGFLVAPPLIGTLADRHGLAAALVVILVALAATAAGAPFARTRPDA
jgi:predicted MFS family arabinose efflux permease